MPRIPGVPTLEPVNQPMMSPAEAGKPGQTIAGLGEATNDTVETGLALDLYIKKAQEHVDSLAAQNDLAKVYADTQNQLAKTQNSRDVAGVIEQSNKTLNDVAAQWSKSPAAVGIQMSADALRPDLTRIGTVRQVDLMGKELKITLNQQAEVLAGNYAADRAAGGSGDMALGAFSTAVAGGVKTGLLGDAEAGEYVRNFRIAGQSLQARLALESPDPKTNLDMVNQLEQHPESFPDLTKEQVGDLIQKGTAAFETHTRQMEFAKQQLTVNTIAPSIIKGATDEQGTFHLDQALTAASHLDPKEEEIVAPYLHNHAALANAELEKSLTKTQDQIEQDISHNKFNDAMKLASSQRNAAESAGSPWYANMSKRIDAARREANATYRANFNFDYAMKKKEEDMASTHIANQLLPGIISGQVTQQQLTDSLGVGKLSYSRYLQLNHIMTTMTKDPDTKKALTLMGDALPPPPKDASAEDKMEYDNLAMNLVDAYQQGVAEKDLKGDDKTKYAMELVKPYTSKDVADRINKIFFPGTAPKPTSFMDRVEGFFDAHPAPWHGKGQVRGAPEGSATGQTFTDGGRTYNIPADQVEDFKKDHPNAR